MSILGSGKESNPALVRMFLRADSAEKLVSLQLQVNLLLKGRADYTDFSNVDGKWYCWFTVDIDRNPEVLKVNNGSD